jgi:hypothetical protein
MKTKTEYKLAYRVVCAIVREWDPYSLFAVGCPDDEFDLEINSLVGQIPRIKSQKDATLALSRVFSAAFEPNRFTPDECASVGAKLFAALSANGLIV